MGRTWPRTKQVDIALGLRLLVRLVPWNLKGRGGGVRALVSKHDVIAAKGPAVVAWVHMVAEREHAPR